MPQMTPHERERLRQVLEAKPKRLMLRIDITTLRRLLADVEEADRAVRVAVRAYAQGMVRMAEAEGAPELDLEKLVQLGVERAYREAQREAGRPATQEEPSDIPCHTWRPYPPTAEAHEQIYTWRVVLPDGAIDWLAEGECPSCGMRLDLYGKAHSAPEVTPCAK